MKKVTIEITEEGWETKVEIDGQTFIEKHISTPTGARGSEGNLNAEDKLTDEIIDALGGFTQYEIMKALKDHWSLVSN